MKVAGECKAVTKQGSTLVLTVRNELDGDQHDIDVRCWGQVAEHAADLKEGDRFSAEGRCESKTWNSKATGKPWRSTSFNARFIERLEAPPPPPPIPSESDDEIPF